MIATNKIAFCIVAILADASPTGNITSVPGRIVGISDVSGCQYCAVRCRDLCAFVRPTCQLWQLWQSGQLENQEVMCFQWAPKPCPDTKQIRLYGGSISRGAAGFQSIGRTLVIPRSHCRFRTRAAGHALALPIPRSRRSRTIDLGEAADDYLPASCCTTARALVTC